MALAAHLGVQPSTIVTAILAQLSAFKLDGSSGSVRTIKRYAGNEFDPERIDAQLAASTPAWLVADLKGPWSGNRTSGKLFEHTLNFGIICAASTYESVEKRLGGDSGTVLTSSTVTLGIDDLLDAATYYALKAMEGLRASAQKITNPRPIAHRWLRVEAGKYLAVAELACERRLDSWDDDPTDALTTLGIVHDPTDPDDLWEVDNETPKSEMPPTTDGGVATL